MIRFVLITLTLLSLTPRGSAQESGPDSASLKDIIRSVFNGEQPKISFMSQFSAEMQDDGSGTESEFRLRNLRLFLLGSVGKNFRYYFQGNFNGTYEMLDLKLSYIFDESFRIDAGRFKTPFGAEYSVRVGKIFFVKRSSVASAIGTFRQYGVQGQLSFLRKRINMTAGIFNGSDTAQKGISLFVGKIHSVPLNRGEGNSLIKIEIGGSLAYSDDENDLPLYYIDRNVTLYNANIRLNIKKIWIHGEYSSATSAGIRTSDGFYSDIGWHICPGWEIAGRFDWFSSRREQISSAGEPISRKYLIGANYYPLNNIRVQVDYEHDQITKVNTGWLVLQYAVNYE